jgi:hypothetical protein
MKIVKKFESFILEFKETEKNTPVLYKDNNLEVKVVKTFDACAEQGKGTNWCSNDKTGFYRHNKTANMFRFNFKDGYKLRLTWDYVHDGGTHWGQGGVVDGEKQSYIYIFPRDTEEPFLFDYTLDDKKSLVKRIESIPQNIIDIVHDYQSKHSIDKSANMTKMYNEISKIKIIDVKIKEENSTEILKVTIKYKFNDYKVNIYKIGGIFKVKNYGDLPKDFKNLTAIYGSDESLSTYIIDKTKEFIKKNNISL